MTTFPFYADPGHGWLKVSKRQLEMVGLTPDSFTPYSYKRGNSFFLEQDADARGYQRCIDEKTEQSVCYDIYVKKWTNEK